MKIPFGFGKVRIEFPNGITCDFNVEINSWREEDEVRDEFINLYGTVDSKVIGYYLSFKLDLTDPDLRASVAEQTNILEYLYQYNINPRIDKSFKLYPAYSSDLPGLYCHPDSYFTVIQRNRKYDSIASKKRSGQVLTLELETIDMITPDQYKTVLYRDTDGTWGAYGRAEKKAINKIGTALPGGAGGLS